MKKVWRVHDDKFRVTDMSFFDHILLKLLIILIANCFV